MNITDRCGPLSTLRAALLAGTACCLIMPLSRAEAVSTDATGVPAHWSAKKLEFTFSGFTSRYSCDGLEDKVRVILLLFGARKDVKVKATGCEYSASQVRPENFSKMAWVKAEFSSLAPGPDPAGTGAVTASWSKVLLTPKRPNFMTSGECELVQEMRPVLEKGFSLREVQYRTDCMPKQVTLADYTVQAEALQPSAN